MKILLIAMSGIGDTLIATPLIRELRANWPTAEIDVLTMWPGARDLIEGNPAVRRVWQKNVIEVGPVRALPFLKKLRNERYDISLNAHTQGRPAYRIIAGFIGADLRVSHAYDNTRAWERLLIHRTVPEDYTVHSVDNNNRLLPLAGGKVLLASHAMDFVSTDAEETWARDFLAANNLGSRPRLGIHVGSGATKNLTLKRWPIERWIELLRRITREHPDVAVLMFGGPQEREPHDRIRSEIANPCLFTPESKNLRQAGALMRHCNAFLSVDTALMHLAAAVKVPNQVVIEAPTLNPTNVPYGNSFTIVPNKAVGGRNLEYYRYDGKPIKGTDAELIGFMMSIRPEDVYEVLAARLGLGSRSG